MDKPNTTQWPPATKEAPAAPEPVGVAVDVDGDGVADVIVDEEGNETEV